jgi:hypothetical protein
LEGTKSNRDAIEARWPSGLVQRLGNIDANRIVKIREGIGITEIGIAKSGNTRK